MKRFYQFVCLMLSLVLPIIAMTGCGGNSDTVIHSITDVTFDGDAATVVYDDGYTVEIPDVNAIAVVYEELEDGTLGARMIGTAPNLYMSVSGASVHSVPVTGQYNTFQPNFNVAVNKDGVVIVGGNVVVDGKVELVSGVVMVDVGDYSMLDSAYQLTSVGYYEHNGKRYANYDQQLKTKLADSLTEITVLGEMGGMPVTKLLNSAFVGYNKLTKINLPEGITEIEDGAFAGCSALTEISFPSSVTKLGGCVFCSCTALTRLTLPDGIGEMGSRAFVGCSSLEEIVLPKSLAYLPNSCFEKCEKLTSILVSEENTSLCSIDGNLYSSEGRRLISYAPGKQETSFTVPEGTEFIGSNAFDGAANLTEIILPESLSRLSNLAFFPCESLNVIRYNSSLSNWNTVSIETDFSEEHSETVVYTVICNDGEATLTFEPME